MLEARLEQTAPQQWRVSGEMTFATVPELFLAAKGVFDGEPHRVAVDLGGVSRADSAGIALLVEWMRAAARAGKGVHFSGAPAQMLAIAKAGGLEAILPLTAR